MFAAVLHHAEFEHHSLGRSGCIRASRRDREMAALLVKAIQDERRVPSATPNEFGAYLSLTLAPIYWSYWPRHLQRTLSIGRSGRRRSGCGPEGHLTHACGGKTRLPNALSAAEACLSERTPERAMRPRARPDRSTRAYATA